MSIEGGSRNNEIQDQEINRSTNEQAERNQAETQRSGDKLEANSTIDNEGERKQIDSKEDGADDGRGSESSLDKKDSIDNEQDKEPTPEGEMQGHMAPQGAEANTGGQEQSLENNSEIADDPENGLENKSEIEQPSQLESLSLDEKNTIEDEIKNPIEENSEGSSINEKTDSLDNKLDISDGTEKTDAAANTEAGEKTEKAPSLDDKNQIQDDTLESNPEKQPETPVAGEQLEQNVLAENDGKQMEKSDETIDTVSEQKNEPQALENTSDANQEPNEGEPSVSEYEKKKDQKELPDVNTDENNESLTSDTNNQEGLNKAENFEEDPNEVSNGENTSKSHEGTGMDDEVSNQDGEQKKPDGTDNAEHGTEENSEANVDPTQDVNEASDANTTEERLNEATPTENKNDATEESNPENGQHADTGDNKAPVDKSDGKAENVENAPPAETKLDNQGNEGDSYEQKQDTSAATSGEQSDGNDRADSNEKSMTGKVAENPDSKTEQSEGDKLDNQNAEIKSDNPDNLQNPEPNSQNEISRPLSERLNDVYDKYYDAAENHGVDEYGDECAILSPEKKEKLVNELKQEYDKTPLEDRGDTFVPESADYIKDDAIGRTESADGTDYWINYDWPENDGFKTENGVVDKTEATIQKGDVIDRVGHNYGRFTSPVVDGKADSVGSRALPYHFTQGNIENEPSYHQFRATDDIVPQNIQDKIDDVTDDEKRASLQSEFDRSKGKTYEGEIGHAFTESDGGGTQYHMPMSVQSLIDLGLLEEI